jgi:hypothetical protein
MVLFFLPNSTSGLVRGSFLSKVWICCKNMQYLADKYNQPMLSSLHLPWLSTFVSNSVICTSSISSLIIALHSHWLHPLNHTIHPSYHLSSTHIFDHGLPLLLSTISISIRHPDIPMSHLMTELIDW